MRGFKLLLFFVFFCLTPPAEAAMCVNGRPSLDQEYKDSKYVIEAKVVHIFQNVDSPYLYNGKIYHDREDKITLKVVKSYKVPSKKILSFLNPHDSASIPLKKGGRYILFMSSDDKSKQLYVNTCGSSGAINDIKSRDIALLSKWSREHFGESINRKYYKK